MWLPLWKLQKIGFSWFFIHEFCLYMSTTGNHKKKCRKSLARLICFCDSFQGTETVWTGLNESKWMIFDRTIHDIDTINENSKDSVTFTKSTIENDNMGDDSGRLSTTIMSLSYIDFALNSTFFGYFFFYFYCPWQTLQFSKSVTLWYECFALHVVTHLES